MIIVVLFLVAQSQFEKLDLRWSAMLNNHRCMENNLSQTSNNEAPKVKKYTDIYKFIQDVYNYRKALDEKFTLDLWSYELGFKSRSFIFMVYHKQRQITLKFIQSLSTSLKLSDQEQDYLFLLFDYSKTHKISQKRVYLNQILESLETNVKNIDLQYQSKFLSSQNLMLIKLLLAFDDIKGTEKELARLLGISAKEIKKNLAELKEMDLVVPVTAESQKDVIWKSKDKAFVVARDVINESVHLFHRNTLDEAKAVLDQKDTSQKFQSIFFALPKELFPELVQEMDTFLTKIKNKYGYNDFENKNLIKLNVQAYPVVKNDD